MSSQHHVLLMMILLVQASGTQSRPSPEETDADLAPRWMEPIAMCQPLCSTNAGSTIKFLCKATGNPVPSLHWFKNGEKITTDQRVGGFKIRDHTMALIMESLVPSDGGNYTCVVENKHGRLEHTFQLEVLGPSGVRGGRPTLEAGLLADQTAVVGSEVSFECKVMSGVSTHLQWIKHIKVNGSSVGPDGLPYVQVLKSLSTSGGSEVLTLSDVTLEDAGEYTCLVGNAMGISHRSAKLTVISKVPGSKQTLEAGLLADQTAVVGSDVSFECKGMSQTTTHMQWLKHITVNGCGRKPEVQVLKTSVKSGEVDVLTLRNVTLDDAGEYICLGGNSEGASYQSAWLTVLNGTSDDQMVELKPHPF